MAEIPYPGTTQTEEEVESAIKRVTFGVALKAAFVAVYAEVPFLALPVIRQVFEYCVTKFMEKFYGELSLGILGAVIDIKTQAERVAYERARDELKAQLAKADDDVATLKARQAEFERRLADLIRFPRAA